MASRCATTARVPSALLSAPFAAAAGELGPAGRRGAALPPARAGRHARGLRRRAGGAPGRRPRARLHRPRAASRRAAAPARRPRAAGLRVPGRAATGAPGAARWPSARSWRPSAASPPLLLLDDVMSELDADRRGAARGAPERSRPERHHHDGPRPRARRAGDRACSACEWPTGRWWARRGRRRRRRRELAGVPPRVRCPGRSPRSPIASLRRRSWPTSSGCGRPPSGPPWPPARRPPPSARASSW